MKQPREIAKLGRNSLDQMLKEELAKLASPQPSEEFSADQRLPSPTGFTDQIDVSSPLHPHSEESAHDAVQPPNLPILD